MIVMKLFKSLKKIFFFLNVIARNRVDLSSKFISLYRYYVALKLKRLSKWYSCVVTENLSERNGDDRIPGLRRVEGK